jgi:subtilisin family serine protease
LIALALFLVAATPARAGLPQPSKPAHVLAAAADQDTDPLVPFEWWRAAIGADQLNSPGTGKPVTVVDSGLDITHPEFASRPNTEILNRQTTSEPDEDHGTAVSSVVGATNNGVGLVGVYPNAVLRMWDASPFGILDDVSAVQGIRAAALRGPGVINLSFGGETDDPMLQAAIDFAVRSGSLVVAAAGNDGGFGSPPNYPAFYPHVLTVGATDRSNQVAAFSSVSPTVDLAAPGVDMPIAEPLAVEPAGYTTDAAGTSFASPLVAGAAAWVWTVRPDLDNSQLFEIMRRSATDIGTPGFDSASGYGLLNIPRALSYKTPLRDPQEPNEEPREIEAKGLFSKATAPLTVPGRTTGSIAARVDRSEDPIDLYRAWAPAGLVLRAHVTGSVRVRVLQRAGHMRALAVGRRGTGTYRNRARGTYVYIEVRPATRLAEYRLRITAART